MKKEYISPEMYLDTMEVTELLVASPNDPAFTPDDERITTETSGNLSRHFSWESSEEEEDF